jgi:hypothetical protein
VTDREQFRFAITVDSFNALESPQPCKNIFLQEAMIDHGKVEENLIALCPHIERMLTRSTSIGDSAAVA